ncbi:FxLYD domain-containing protein [Clostridium kluyveri]|uniref:Zinc ribbon domain-containing protein n=1 Tax=Clostridium kluyveri TaxID=1534 RepID=A0A1L5F5F2_CLOKL|nr:FxLYD domain-containing protein [Clostridium kluyveri]APM38207.1 zinc ribbon domain-containing protein [Clostridium kluyveri]
MFCYNCKIEVSDNAVFCHKCGARLKKEDTEINSNSDTIQVYKINKILKNTVENSQVKTLPPIKTTSKKNDSNKNGNKIYFKFSFYKNKNIMIPLVSTILMTFITIGYYFYEITVSKNVEKNRVNAETIALKGNISEAYAKVDKALSLRPNNKTLQADKKILQDGENINSHINIVDNYIKKKNYIQAFNELDKANDLIYNKQGAFYSLLNKTIENKRMAVTVIQIKSEMNNESSIDDLADLLTKISNYTIQEAKDTANELRNRISSVAYDTANEYLKKNNFISALDTINKGITYNPKDEKLLNFKETIVAKKNSFEKAEQNRIQQALTSAATEDKNNKTNAVEVTSTSTNINKYGDFVIKGTVKNIATKPISSIKIYYDIFDSNNKNLGSGSTYVYPNYLDVGATGKFENTEYNMLKGHHIKITNITWFLQ